MNATSALVVLREAAALSRARLLLPVVVTLVVACAAAVVNLTSGAAAGAQADVVEKVNSASARTLFVQAPTTTPLDSSLIARVASLDGVKWLGFGERHGGSALTTVEAAQLLGFETGTGSIKSDGLPTVPLVGIWSPPRFLSQFDFQALRLYPAEQSGAVVLVVILVDDPANLASLSRAVVPLLGAADSVQLKVSRDVDLTTLRDSVAARLSAFNEGLLVITFSSAAGLVAVILSAMVMLRRKDFGRRRALGATRPTIIALVLTQVGGSSVIGALLGTGFSLAQLSITQQPVPATDFTIASAVLLIVAAVLAALVPAALAATRQPLLELRTP